MRLAAASGARLTGPVPVRVAARRGRPMNNRELVESLCAASPPLREACKAHLATFGTLIPHVFMSDVLARIGACLSAPTAKVVAAHRAEVARLLGALEDGIVAGDRETRNVIAISFVGDGAAEPFFGLLLPLLGPKVRAQSNAR